MFEIYLEGTIGAEMWADDPHFTPADLRAQLVRADGADVVVYLNSGGGIAADGLAIYHDLRAYAGRVEIVVTGVAASAASLIAMAGDTITLRAGSMMMLHDPGATDYSARGTEDEHRALADFLAKLSSGYAAIYAARAKITPEAAREIMRAETWYSPAEAVAAGFADAAQDAEAVAAASFAWNAYHHAPRRLLAGMRADGPSRLAVLAMIGGGLPASTTKGKTVDPEEDQLPPEGEDTTTGGAPEAALPDDDEADAAAPEGDDDEADSPEDDDEADAAVATAICDLVTMHNGTPADVRGFLSARMTLAQVVTHYRQKGNSVPKPKPGPQMRIVRDERDTRRAGMTAALVAQMLHRDPTDQRARPFMDMSLAQMAATASGHRGPLRTASDRLAVFMDMHATGDFPIALGGAVNRVLGDRYAEAAPVYRTIARLKSFKDFRPHTIVNAADFPRLQQVNEAGEIKSGTIGDGGESVSLVSYAVTFALTRQMLVNDDIGLIADLLADQGRAVARFEEETFFALLFASDGPTLSNGRALFHSTDKTKAAAGAAPSVLTLSTGRAAIRAHTSASGSKLGIAPRYLLTGPDVETLAEQLTASLVPAEASQANPFSQRLVPITSAELTGNAWYLLPDPAVAAPLIYGFLEGASGPRMRMEEVFGRQGSAFQLEHDFAAGAGSRAGLWKNAGA